MNWIGNFQRKRYKWLINTWRSVNFPAIKEMQIKTTLRFHLTPVRMAINKNKNNNKCWWGYSKTETLIQCWWKCKLVQPFWKAVWRFLQTIKIELPYDPVISLLGIYPKECKLGYNWDTCTLMVTAALFTIAKLWRQPRRPTTDELLFLLQNQRLEGCNRSCPAWGWYQWKGGGGGEKG
jgi:hypothetical protein